MKISAFKKHLSTLESLHFVQPDGRLVPAHFHVTEMGLSTKHFIDCGGTIRQDKVASFQLWVADDVQHRLQPAKLLGIVDKAAPLMGAEDLDIEVEFQGDTIGKYSLETEGYTFVLVPKFTDCLAKETCGVPETIASTKPAFEVVATGAAVCVPGGGCC